MTISRFHPIPRFALPYTPADFDAGLRAIVQGAPPPHAFGLLGDSPRFWTRSGRQALRLLLEALELEPGAGVALPLFTDPSLVKAIAAAGHRPVFIDVDPQFLTLDPHSLKQAQGTFSAVLAVHLFGQLADMPAILAAAAGAPVIEDTAHAPLSYLHGRMAGRFGVANFYSFASTKYWPAGGGGLVIAHQANLARKLALAVPALAAPSRLQELRSLAMQAAKAIVFHRRLYGLCGRPLRRWVEQWALLEPCLDQQAIQRSWAAVACRQALRFPPRVALQRANSLQLLSRLGAVEDVVLPWERPGAQYNYHLFPVLLRDREERATLMRSLWTKFVDTSRIYSGVVAESVADRLITLPNHAALSSGDIDHVAQSFLSSLRSYRGPRRKHAVPDRLTVMTR